MTRAIRAAGCLLLASSFSLTAVRAQTWYGERQSGWIQSQQLESQVDWVNGRRGAKGPFLKLLANKKAIGKGKNAPVAAAAAVLNFGLGTQVDYLSFTYYKLKEGTFFDETTDPIARVEYATTADPLTLQYKTLTWPVNSAGYTWNKEALTAQGLPPETTLIYRFAIVAKPKVFDFIDDYAHMEVEQFRYHDFLSRDKNTQTPTIDTYIHVDGNGNKCTDQLLLGA